MKQVLQHIGSRELELAEVPEPGCRSGGVLVRNRASLVSAGTEKMIIDFANKSLVGKAQQRPDLARKVLAKVKRDGLRSALDTVRAGLNRALPLGYSCAGVVIEVGEGAEEFGVGDRVACAGMGYASHAETVFVPKNLAVSIPPEVSFDDAAYVTLGAIALQGVRTAEIQLGDVVAVIGLGLLGQLTVQILRAAGCRVIGIDLEDTKVALALQAGAHRAWRRGDDVVAKVMETTRGIGVDAVVITAAAETNDPIELAGEIARDRARVSMVGAVRMDVPRKVYYEKELQLRMSRSYGPGRYDPGYEEMGIDYPIGYVRWTERRNMEEFIRLVAAGAVQPSALTTHRYPIAQARRAYSLITEGEESFTGVLLQYDEASRSAEARTVQRHGAPVAGTARGVAIVGAGNFASSILLPRLKRLKGWDLAGVCTSTGATASGAAERFGFRYATTDPDSIFSDPAVRAVVIATRHDSHASLAASALEAGKAVFVEKPLAIDEEGLEHVIDAQRRTGGVLTVGFNRRFSPLSRAARDAFPDDTPLTISYRVNAGPIPANSWVMDPSRGGGRIIGEVCHLIDLIQFLTGALPVEAFTYAAGAAGDRMHDTVVISLSMSDGSIASVTYAATGDRSYPKERIEVFGGGTVAVIDDFRTLKTSTGGRETRMKRLSQAKGFDEEIAAFFTAALDGTLPIPMTSLVATTRATFAIERSLLTGAPVVVECTEAPQREPVQQTPRYSAADAG